MALDRGDTMRKALMILAMMVILSVVVTAHGEEDFARAEEIIEQRTSCDNLTQDQLALLGDYYMEQMHPGEEHEYMDQMMGGEGSESLEQMHINMARSFYCGEHEAYGMMGNQQMGPGMMYNNEWSDARMGYGMMGTGMAGWWLGSLLWIAAAAFIFGVIFWWTKKMIMKKR